MTHKLLEGFKNFRQKNYEGPARATEEQIVLESINNLKSYPSVQKALAENRVTLKPWLFDMECGAVLEYDGRDFKIISI